VRDVESEYLLFDEKFSGEVWVVHLQIVSVIFRTKKNEVKIIKRGLSELILVV
jgi:hypothetical protein